MNSAFSLQGKPQHEFWEKNEFYSKPSFTGDLTRLVPNSSWLFRVGLINGLELVLLGQTSSLKYSESPINVTLHPGLVGRQHPPSAFP